MGNNVKVLVVLEYYTAQLTRQAGCKNEQPKCGLATVLWELVKNLCEAQDSVLRTSDYKSDTVKFGSTNLAVRGRAEISGTQVSLGAIL